jgi:Rhodopirellula transposase DDE domain
MGFSLKANKESIEGASHADRDTQFQHINRTGKAFEAKGQPVISVDCKPLTSLETMIELISHITTEEGLTVSAVKDTNSYPTGLKVSDQDMAALKITSNPFHGDWNYTIQPQ